MQIEKQSTKFIKPDTPTPANLGHYKIGFTDENSPAMNVSIVLFFSGVSNLNSDYISQLEKSLEKALTRFYPLAGRYLEEIHVVDCKDQGAEFIQAKANFRLDDIVGSEENLRLVDELSPSAIGAVDQVTDPILSVQVCTFECGGVALGVSISHRVADASTMCTFLNEWAAISRGENQGEFTGTGFNSSLFFPPRGMRPFFQGLPRSKSNDVQTIYVTKKLSFNDNEISNLREKILNERNDRSQQYLSKVQIVSAFIWKLLMEIDRRTHDYPRKSVVQWPINLRRRETSIIPKDSCGNFSAVLITKCNSTETSTHELGDLLKTTFKNFINDYLKVCSDNEQMQTMITKFLPQIYPLPSTEQLIVLTSWCKFPFYEADFGFGKPVWVNRGTTFGKDIGNLIDGVGGNGIEAYVGIEKEHIPLFEQIKAFAAS